MKKRTVAKKTNVHVVPLGNGWVVRNDDRGKFIVITNNKRDALTVGKGIAKSENTTLITHGKDGKIMNRTSYKSSAIPIRKSSSRKRTASAKTKKVTIVR